jgi:hypothetical protein
MPEISRFLGIIIYMNFYDHSPPHFHAKYGAYEIIVEIKTGVVKGKFPRRAMTIVLEWFTLHQQNLLINWENAQQGLPLINLAPLE